MRCTPPPTLWSTSQPGTACSQPPCTRMALEFLAGGNAAVAVLSTKCLNWSIVTRAHVPRQRHNFCWNAAAASSARCAPRGGKGTAGGHRHAARRAQGAHDARHKSLLRVASCLAFAAEILSVAGHGDDLVGPAGDAFCGRLVRVFHLCRRAGGALAGTDPAERIPSAWRSKVIGLLEIGCRRSQGGGER